MYSQNVIVVANEVNEVDTKAENVTAEWVTVEATDATEEADKPDTDATDATDATDILGAADVASVVGCANVVD